MKFIQLLDCHPEKRVKEFSMPEDQQNNPLRMQQVIVARKDRTGSSTIEPVTV